MHRVREVTIIRKERSLSCHLFASAGHPIPVPSEVRKDRHSGEGSSAKAGLGIPTKKDRIDPHYFRSAKRCALLKVFEHLASILMGEAAQLADQLLRSLFITGFSGVLWAERRYRSVQH